MFSLVCRPLRERWADILENDDYPSGLTPRGFLGMVVIKLVYRFLMVLLVLLDHFQGLDQLVKALGLGQFMRTLLGIRTQKGDSDAFTPPVKPNDPNGKKSASDQGFVNDDHSAVLSGSSRDAFPSKGFDSSAANPANEKTL